MIEIGQSGWLDSEAIAETAVKELGP